MAAAGKKPNIANVLKVLKTLHGAPQLAERPDDALMDHLLVMVLSRRTTRAKRDFTRL